MRATPTLSSTGERHSLSPRPQAGGFFAVHQTSYVTLLTYVTSVVHTRDMTTTTTVLRYEKTSSGWDAVLSTGVRIALRSSDGVGKVGSRQGGWCARRAGLTAHGETRAEAVAAWIINDAADKERWAQARARRAATPRVGC